MKTKRLALWGILLMILSCLVLISGCRKNNKKASSNIDGQVTALITVGAEQPYQFSFSPGNTKTALVAGPNTDGQYNLKASFPEVKPYKAIIVAGYITGEGTFGYDKGFQGEGFLSLSLAWENKSGEVSRYNLMPISEAGKYGKAEFIVTSFSKERIKGTFSATLYNQQGEKAVIKDGKFNVGVNSMMMAE